MGWGMVARGVVETQIISKQHNYNKNSFILLNTNSMTRKETVIVMHSPFQFIMLSYQSNRPASAGITGVEATMVLSSKDPPAPVGITKYLVFLFTQFQDHPRIRGDNTSLPWSVQGALGSPPHSRG